MKRFPLRWIVLGLVLAGSLALFARFGFRCQALPRSSGDPHNATLCYAWFRPHLLTFADASGQVFYYGFLDGDFAPGDLPLREYADLFGSGKISAFVVNRYGSPYGIVGKQEISTRDDGRIDLVLEFHGKALTKALEVQTMRCRRWTADSVRFAGRVATKEICADSAAFVNISAGRAREIVAAMEVPKDRAITIARLEESRGKPLGSNLRM